MLELRCPPISFLGWILSWHLHTHIDSADALSFAPTRLLVDSDIIRVTLVLTLVANTEQVSLDLRLEPLDDVTAPRVIADDFDLDVSSWVKLIFIDGDAGDTGRRKHTKKASNLHAKVLLDAM